MHFEEPVAEVYEVVTRIAHRYPTLIRDGLRVAMAPFVLS